MSKEARSNSRTMKRTPFRGPAVIAITVAGVAAVALLTFVGLRTRAQGGVSEFMHLHGLAVAPWAPDDVFVSSHQGLMRIDRDGQWSVVSRVPHDFMGFQANPTEDGVLYSSGHPAAGSGLPNPVGFMVSRDAGATWKIRSLAGQVDFHTMSVQPTNGDVIYGLSRNLMRSLDAGKTWEGIQSPQLSRLGNVYAIAVSPDHPDTLMVGASSGLWRSGDAGQTWTSVLQGVPVTSVAFRPGGRLFAYAATPDRGLMSSPDGGGTWTEHDLFVEGQDAIVYIAPHPTRDETLTVGSFGQNIYRTTDFGRTWITLAQGGVPQEHDHEDHEH